MMEKTQAKPLTAAQQRQRDKKRRTWLRTGVQLFFFVSMPGAFVAGFSGVKQIFLHIGAGEVLSVDSFTLSLLGLCGFTLLFDRFFCGYACAFGSLGDAVWALSGLIQKKLFHRKKQLCLPERAVLLGQKVKYLLLAWLVALYVTRQEKMLTGASPWEVFSRLTALHLPPEGFGVGIGLLVLILLWLQGAVWATDFTTLTPGQRARTEVILRQQALSAGEFVSEEKLTAGEYALLQSGEFSWASLNFSKGRLIVEAAAAKPVPDIASGTLHGITARVAGTVLETNLTSGTMLVTPGQAVEAGQGLIGTARMERDGTLIFQPAAGRVLAQFEWEFSETLPATVAADQLTGSKSHQYQLHFAGKSLALPPWSSHQENARAITRHLHPAFWGLALPCSVEETVFYHTQNETLSYTGDQMLALARLHSRQALYAAYPDAVLLTRKEDFSAEGDQFHYRVCYTIAADICQENTKTAED